MDDDVLRAWMADAEAHALILVFDMRGDRAQAVVAGIAATGLHPHFPRREFDLVVEHHDFGELDLVEVRGFGDRVP